MTYGREEIIKVQLVTPVGTIVVELFPKRAPITVQNFLRLINDGAYEQATFYRAVRPDNDPGGRLLNLIQGGLGPDFEDSSPLPKIKHESTGLTGLRHKDGALSMARWSPGTASSEFFIVLGDTPELDFGGTLNPDLQGFSVFGYVEGGIDVVRDINLARTGTTSGIPFMRNQALIPALPIVITRAS